ncbi:MAG TPA: DJ-1/PfpI family protein [Chitinophaga sp.]|uniref:DJ-1/PfpI family protein n=1 Tax=Chitinophaga sp. TaxID=1869181 RepID=UPI002B92A17B|nr:DJ-1/PfpI family protein [Chitinophaga sp.]HVI46449.1 DJ-1/PfpI family protein [Chitinophaga sp.]
MKSLLPFVLFLLSLTAFAQPKQTKYVCPPCGPCDTLLFDQPGKCPHCNMELIRYNPELSKNSNMTIGFYLYDGVEVLDFAGPMEVFSYAGFKVFTIAKKKEPVVSQRILKIIPDYSIEDAPHADILAFFGGDADVSANDPEVISWIKSRSKDTRTFFSVCTGAFIIGKAGLLDNQTATTFHAAIDDLRKLLPSTKVLSDVRFVDNGKVITTAGISAGIDGALHLVATLKGEEAAMHIARTMEYDKYVPGQGLVIKK